MPYDPTPKSNVREKVAYYLLGIGIGLVLLGLIVWGRNRAQAPSPANTAPAAAPSGSTGR